MSHEKLSHDGRIRLNTMVKTNNGFEIAETDLQLRGPGNIEGTQQSGVLDLKVANIVTDQELLIKVREYVVDIFEKDPQLSNPEHIILNQSLKANDEGLAWNKIS
jgi:ATP-dependent DNA helicase RecG